MMGHEQSLGIDVADTELGNAAKRSVCGVERDRVGVWLPLCV